VALDTCYGPCTDQACYDACDAAHPTGVTLWNAMYSCLLCDPATCSVDCAAYCGAPTACDVGDCATCINSTCAGTACSTEIDACANSAECVALDTCYGPCTDQACYDACDAAHPTGVALWNAMYSCLLCDPTSCSQDCAAYCGAPTACDVGDCTTCVNSTCADTACTTEYDACVNSTECIAFYNCASVCTTSACITQCENQYATGANLYYAWTGCLYCSPSTCSVDCATECGTAATCDVGNCATCQASTCAQQACQTEVTACTSVPDCAALDACHDACGNNGCHNQCNNAHPGSVALYNAMMSCLRCDAASCSQDCAAQCP
jgi:hypothetical protein